MHWGLAGSVVLRSRRGIGGIRGHLETPRGCWSVGGH